MKDRVKALKKVQFETIKVEEEYYKEIHAIDLKYQKQYDDINSKRLKIIRYIWHVSKICLCSSYIIVFSVENTSLLVTRSTGPVMRRPRRTRRTRRTWPTGSRR